MPLLTEKELSPILVTLSGIVKVPLNSFHAKDSLPISCRLLPDSNTILFILLVPAQESDSSVYKYVPQKDFSFML